MKASARSSLLTAVGAGGLILVAVFLHAAPQCERRVRMEGPRSPGEEARRALFAEAGNLMGAGRYDEAISRYEEFLRQWPRSAEAPEAMARLGEAYYKKGDVDQARVWFHQVLDRWPRDPAAAVAAWGLALDAFQRQDCRQVESLVTDYRALARDAAWDRMTLLAAECKVKSGDRTQALFLFGEEVRDGRDEELRKQGRKKAEELVKEMTAEALENAALQHPGKFPGDLALLERARQLLEKDRVPQAEEAIKTFTKDFPDSPYAVAMNELKLSLSQRSQVKFNRIGVLLPTSGRLAGYGERALKGVMLAGNVFNEEQPIMPAEFIIRDSSDPDKVAEMVRELVEKERVIVIVGPLRTGTAQKAAQVAQELKVPIVTLSPGESMTRTGDMVYQNCLTKSAQVEALVDYAVNGQGLKSFGILSPNDDYGREFAEFFAEEVVELGGTVVAAETYEVGATDYKGAISALKGRAGKGMEALFIPDSWDKVAMIAPQLRFYQITGLRLLGINAWHDEKLIAKTQAEDLRNVVFTDVFAPELGQPAFNDFSRRYYSEYNEPPDLVTAQAFETVDLILHLIEEYQIRDRSQLKLALDHVEKYPGTLGPVTVQSNGRFHKPISLFTITEGKFRVIATVE
jgi:ABC-type branched-subunit amino acid transport system substrate-binding protein/TolA-binding protein